MQHEISIKATNLSKKYKLYEKHSDRLKESLSFTKKQYHKDHYALHDVSFTIRKGETVGILGANGAGKSTLLKILTGVTTPSLGSVEVIGKISALLELGAGFNPEYTGLENIYLNGTMMGYHKKEMQSKLQSILDFADIGDFIYQPVKTYSSGMFARLAFAVAINVEPEILIVDEALSVGDMRFQMKCIDKMKSLMECGTTVLFVSHDINTVRRFCSIAIWLDKGEVKLIGEVNAVADSFSDFLKLENSASVIKKEIVYGTINWNEKPFIPNNGIAEIMSLDVWNQDKQVVTEITINQPITIRVVYDVYDDSIKNPVLGVAVFAIDDTYICGLNTLLDKEKIPWKYGRNEFYLDYYEGIRVLGGNYYFKVAVFDETASIPFDFNQKINQIIVSDTYLAEGVFIIPHKWRDIHE